MKWPRFLGFLTFGKCGSGKETSYPMILESSDEVIPMTR